jgi:hypothetical protein
MKKYAEQHCRVSLSFEPGNLVMLNGKHIKTHPPVHKLEYKLYGPYEILDIIFPLAVPLYLPKTSKIYLVFHVSLLEPFVKDHRDVDLNAIRYSSDPIENASEYDIDKVMGSTDKDRRVYT